MAEPLRVLRLADQQVALHHDDNDDDDDVPSLQGGSGSLPWVYHVAIEVSIAHGDLSRARIFAERASAGWCVSLGDDSPEAISAAKMAADPAVKEL